MKTDGGTAFPTADSSDWTTGMSLRDYFAAKAMAACIIEERDIDNGVYTAEVAYRYADAMLAEREKKS